MKLSELKDKIDFLFESSRDDLEVRIVVKVAGSVAAQPTVGIKSIHSGFDWDAGKLLIYPEVDLRECNRDELKAIQKRLDDIGWDMYENRNLKAENKKLKQRIQELSK